MTDVFPLPLPAARTIPIEHTAYRTSPFFASASISADFLRTTLDAFARRGDGVRFSMRPSNSPVFVLRYVMTSTRRRVWGAELLWAALLKAGHLFNSLRSRVVKLRRM